MDLKHLSLAQQIASKLAAVQQRIQDSPLAPEIDSWVYQRACLIELLMPFYVEGFSTPVIDQLVQGNEQLRQIADEYKGVSQDLRQHGTHRERLDDEFSSVWGRPPGDHAPDTKPSDAVSSSILSIIRRGQRPGS